MGEKGTWEKIIEIKPVGFISQVPPQDHLVRRTYICEVRPSSFNNFVGEVRKKRVETDYYLLSKRFSGRTRAVDGTRCANSRVNRERFFVD